jgi:predicted alpha/beta superfamily hydrolase
LDKISFINDWEVAALLKNEKNALVITSPGSVPENGRIIDTIYFLDGSKAFEIIEI